MKTIKQNQDADRLLNKIKNFKITEINHVQIVAFWASLVITSFMMIYMISKW